MGQRRQHLRLSMGELTKFLSACGLVHPASVARRRAISAVTTVNPDGT
jgi:hypothetical protein